MSTSLFDLKDKTAVVIGGTTGIGLALSLGLAEAGAELSTEQIEHLSRLVSAAGGIQEALAALGQLAQRREAA